MQPDEKTTEEERLWALAPARLRVLVDAKIERLRAEVRDLGRISDTCTFNALREVCSYCQCGRKA